MAVLSRDEYFDAIQRIAGDDTSDDTISFIENMADTYNDMEQRASGDGVDWEQRYNELDRSWKEKYRHRFFSAGNVGVPGRLNEPLSDDEDRGKNITYKDLFK